MASWDDVRRIALDLASRPGVYLTLPAYDGYPMTLLHVEAASFDDLDEAITESWLCRAPKRLAQSFLLGQAGDR